MIFLCSCLPLSACMDVTEASGDWIRHIANQVEEAVLHKSSAEDLFGQEVNNTVSDKKSKNENSLDKEADLDKKADRNEKTDWSEKNVLDGTVQTSPESGTDPADTGGASDTSKKDPSEERVTTRTTGELDDETIRHQIGLSEEYIPKLLEQQAGYYYFDHLSQDDKLLYVEIYQILTRRAEDVRISSMEAGQIERIFQSVLNDHPEIFYVEGYHFTKYTLGEELKKITFRGSYHMDETETEAYKKQIERRVEEWMQPLEHITDEYEYVRQVYESVIHHTNYVTDAREDQNICSVFLYGESVCQGYAKAVQYLLQKRGIQSALVIGSVGEEGHAWNLVKVDQEYYYVDATWGDASYQLENADAAEDRFLGINYDYLCVTTEQLERTHRPADPALMPLCKSLSANYYVREGAYFTSLDTAMLEHLFEEAYAGGTDCVTLKCSQEEVYQQMLTYLIEEQEIFHYLKDRKEVVAYADHKEQLSISFWLSEE